MTITIEGFDHDICQWANEGNYRCAMIMLERAHTALKDSPDPSLVYLRECIERYLMNKGLARAFNLHRAPRGRRPLREKMVREIYLALDVGEAIESEGLTVEKAVETVAANWNMSEAAVKKAYYRNRRKK